MREREREREREISIIIPVFNEENNIKIIADRILQQLNNEDIEIIFIDDGSTDGTLQAIRSIATSSAIRYVSFSRNFGHQNAIKAGFDFASGSCIITMDGDLQHPIEILPKMISLWRHGFDIVHSIREPSTDQSFFKKRSSSLFYKIFSLCTSVPLQSGMADFRLVDRKVAEVCKNIKGEVFFWRGFIPWLGFQQTFINYKPAKRNTGSSKYNLKKMLNLAWNGISSFSTLPIRLASLLGTIGLIITFAYSIYIIWIKISGITIPGWSSVMLLLIFLGSINLIILGILGDYIGKIFLNSTGKPAYILKELNFSNTNKKRDIK